MRHDNQLLAAIGEENTEATDALICQQETPENSMAFATVAI